MGTIHVLPPAVRDRIAAGEVVERPASIVREALDNALDAGATRVEIDLEGGGIDLVSVADDGCGMGPDDAVLAFERHATSKIRTGDDLDAVMSLGFRGEALAAIGAVARVELVTRPAAAPGGTRVVLDRGRLVVAEPAGRQPGTTLSVRNLFAGIPARRKFLKAPATELEHCLAAVQRAALARPSVAFRVRHSGRDLLVAAATDDPKVRIADVLGARWADGLVPVDVRRGDLALAGWVGRSDMHRPGREGIHLFVNHRPVRDPVLMRAAYDAYRGLLPPGRFPVLVLYLEIPPSAVDVNVHPAKAEVRFHRPAEVRSLVLEAIGKALADRGAIPVFGAAGGWAGPPVVAPGPAAAPFAWGAAGGGASPEAAGVREPAAGSAVPSQQVLHERPAVRALAQYRNCYIVAEDAGGLLVVDQHVAHERLIFEQLIHLADAGPLPRQVLLFPATLEVGPEAVALVEAHAPDLARLGFGAEPFGPTTVVVREVPAILGREASPETFLDIVARLTAGDRAGVRDLFRDALATVACHSAVRKGMPLSLEKADYILRGLDACQVPAHCPHGRIISLRVDLSALDRTFDRIS